MRLSTHVQKRFDTEAEVLRGLYDLMEPGKEEQIGSRSVSEALGIKQNQVDAAQRHFRQMGILSARLEYPGGGRISYWKLEVSSKGRALDMLATEHKRELLEGPWDANLAPKYRPRKVKEAPKEAPSDGLALASDKSDDEVRAIAGPDAPSPFAVLAPLRKSESGALVAAAQQYRDRHALLATKLKELREAGINVDEKAITLARDERLETIMLVLPYIEDLTSHDTKYEQLRTNYSELERNYNAVNRELGALRRWRDEVVAARVAAGNTVESPRAQTTGSAQPAEAGH